MVATNTRLDKMKKLYFLFLVQYAIIICYHLDSYIIEQNELRRDMKKNSSILPKLNNLIISYEYNECLIER